MQPTDIAKWLSEDSSFEGPRQINPQLGSSVLQPCRPRRQCGVYLAVARVPSWFSSAPE
jgi:hypothetical protein